MSCFSPHFLYSTIGCRLSQGGFLQNSWGGMGENGEEWGIERGLKRTVINRPYFVVFLKNNKKDNKNKEHEG